MSSILPKILLPFAKNYALSFLGEENIAPKMEGLVQKKVRTQSATRIGKSLGMEARSGIDTLPLTGYDFYRRYFDTPSEGDLLYHLDNYVKAMTSGTMGKPKSFLLPKTGLEDCLQKTGFTMMLLDTHDGEKITFEVGDTIYRNVPGGSHIAVFLTTLFDRNDSGWVRQCPDPDLPFQTKVDYFVEHYKEIDTAYMTVPTLLDEVYPRIGKPLHLKGFITQDTAAGPLKEKIREATEGYPKTAYGSTETMFCSIPSIEHPGAFLFDWRVLYPEFIPEKEKIEDNVDVVREKPDVVSLTDAEAGKRYQLVATPLKNDITRYIMPDVLECVDTGDDILGASMPVFRYHARADRLIMLHNFTRIVENELIEVLNSSGVPYVDFTARQTRDGVHDMMELYIEPKGNVDEATAVKRINERLCDADKDWRDLLSFLKYNPLRVRFLPRGSFNAYLATQIGMPKVDRIGMSEERFKTLLNTAS